MQALSASTALSAALPGVAAAPSVNAAVAMNGDVISSFTDLLGGVLGASTPSTSLPDSSGAAIASQAPSLSNAGAIVSADVKNALYAAQSAGIDQSFSGFRAAASFGLQDPSPALSQSSAVLADPLTSTPRSAALTRAQTPMSAAEASNTEATPPSWAQTSIAQAAGGGALMQSTAQLLAQPAPQEAAQSDDAVTAVAAPKAKSAKPSKNDAVTTTASPTIAITLPTPVIASHSAQPVSTTGEQGVGAALSTLESVGASAPKSAGPSQAPASPILDALQTPSVAAAGADQSGAALSGALLGASASVLSPIAQVSPSDVDSVGADLSASAASGGAASISAGSAQIAFSPSANTIQMDPAETRGGDANTAAWSAARLGAAGALVSSSKLPAGSTQDQASAAKSTAAPEPQSSPAPVLQSPAPVLQGQVAGTDPASIAPVTAQTAALPPGGSQTDPSKAMVPAALQIAPPHQAFARAANGAISTVGAAKSAVGGLRGAAPSSAGANALLSLSAASGFEDANAAAAADPQATSGGDASTGDQTPSFDLASGDPLPVDATAAPLPGTLNSSSTTQTTGGATSQTVANLSAQIAQNAATSTTRFDVQLDPLGLGRVNISVKIDAKGSMSADLSFEKPESASLLKSHSAELQQSLVQAGFDVPASSLSFSTADQNSKGGGASMQAFLNSDANGAGGQSSGGSPGQGGQAQNAGRAFGAASFAADQADQIALASQSFRARGVDIRI